MLWLTWIRSHSMAPALPDASMALTRHLWRTTQVRRGDVVIVRSRELGETVVKRVIGLPGERVTIRSGDVSIDGHALAEPYASPSVFSDTCQVPPGHYFLLGDNRDVSSDSRSWRDPFIPREAIVGRILEWPWARKPITCLAGQAARTESAQGLALNGRMSDPGC
jgi:signal peptidase I